MVLLPDSGRQYLSKVYSDAWMRSTGSSRDPIVTGRGGPVGEGHGELPPLITVLAHDKVRQAVDVLQAHDISQAPVVREETTDVSQFVGSIRDRELLERVFRDPDALQADVAEVMAPPIPMVEWSAARSSRLRRARAGAGGARDEGRPGPRRPHRSDLLDHLAHRRRTP